MIFYALSNAAYRMSLSDPGAELEGRYSRTTTPSDGVENLEAHRGAG